MNEWVTYIEAAEITGLSISGVNKILKSGKLKSVPWQEVPIEHRVSTARLTRCYFLRADVEAFAAASYRQRALSVATDHRVEDLAYLAGLFDGEGCVCISLGNRGSHFCYTLVINVSNTMPSVIHWIADTFGGTVQPRYAGRWRRRDCFYWQVVASLAYQTLRLIKPYMRVKHQQADIAIEFFEHVVAYRDRHIRGVTPEEHQWRESMRQRLRDLNTPVKISVSEARQRYEESAGSIDENQDTVLRERIGQGS